MSRKYKRNRSGEEYKRLSLYLPADLADRIRAESEDRLESQNMVASRMLRDWFRLLKDNPRLGNRTLAQQVIEAGQEYHSSPSYRQAYEDAMSKAFNQED